MAKKMIVLGLDQKSNIKRLRRSETAFSIAQLYNITRTTMNGINPNAIIM